MIEQKENINQERVIQKAIEMAWEGVQVTVEFPWDEKRVYNMVWETTEADDSSGTQPFVEEVIYCDFGIFVNSHKEIPSHISIYL